MQRLINQLMPFFLLGIAIVAFAFGIVLLAYLFMIGALVGLALFAFNWVRHTFFTPKKPNLTKPTKTPGRIIDADDWDSDSH